MITVACPGILCYYLGNQKTLARAAGREYGPAAPCLTTASAKERGKMTQLEHTDHKRKFSMGMFLVALGIVYGDIGTSPMYVMKSIVEGNGGIANVDQDFIIGSLSLVIWTITLLTTVKHVLIALRADNHNEGGIFALYSLVRHCGKWLIIPTMIGGCTMLADGVLTPAVTVTTDV